MSQIDTSTTAGKIQVMSAFERGEKIKFFGVNGGTGNGWLLLSEGSPEWDWSTYDYRIEDPCADLKAAHAAGKTIQTRNNGAIERWHDDPNPVWHGCPENYRIKPLEFPEPPEGRVYHNPKGVTADQVGVPSHRLLLVGESVELEDEFWTISQSWKKTVREEAELVSGNEPWTYRTLRPLPTPKKRVPLVRKDVNGEWLHIPSQLQSDFETRILTIGDAGIRAINDRGSIEFFTYAYLHSVGARISSDRVTWFKFDKEAE